MVVVPGATPTVGFKIIFGGLLTGAFLRLQAQQQQAPFFVSVEE
jgi:hypothetical protein